MMNSSLTTAKILIVDDQQSNIDVLLDLLDMHGFKNIKSITNPTLTLKVFKKFNPDLILLDLMMPKMSGFEVMEQLKTIIPHKIYLPILVLTANISFKAKQQALAAGAKDFLTKPFNVVEVILRIKNLLESRYLHQQLLNQNKRLEEKVAARTSELVKINQELIIAKNKAEESDKIKSAYLETISNEMKTPLNNILGFSSLLETIVDDREIRGMISTISSSGANLLNITNDIFQILTSEKSSIELSNQTFKGSEIFLENRINLIEIINLSEKTKKIKLTFVPDYGLMLDYITADRVKISQTLKNIFRYSVKYFKKGEMEFGFYKMDESKIIFYLKNSGIGIDKDKNEDLSNLFSSVDNTSIMELDGTKIGLAISKRIAVAMNAEIRFESILPNETTFYFSIPVEISLYDINSDVKTINNLIPNLTGKNVLIAENDEQNMRLIKILLHPTKAKIFETINGYNAINEFKKQENIDLVIMETKLPIYDGIKVARLIKKINPLVPILAITSSSSLTDKTKVLRAGCSDIITKPITNIEFYNSLIKCFLPHKINYLDIT